MKKEMFSVVVAILLLFTLMFVASAQEAPDETTAVIQLDDTTVPEQAEPESPGQPDVFPPRMETTDANETLAGNAPESLKKSNTPYFIGAGIALVLFACVSVYCKRSGSKTF
jgi:hypothetical protein